MSESDAFDVFGTPSGPILEGGAVVLRPLGVRELTALHNAFIDADVRRYLWDDAIVDVAQVREILELNERKAANGELGLFGIYPLGSEELVGFTGFWEFFEPPVLELLFGLLPDHWGRGWAFQAANLAIAHARADHGAVRIRASTDAPNSRSISLLERLGFTLDEERQAETERASPGTRTRHFILSGSAESAAPDTPDG